MTPPRFSDVIGMAADRFAISPSTGKQTQKSVLKAKPQPDSFAAKLTMFDAADKSETVADIVLSADKIPPHKHHLLLESLQEKPKELLPGRKPADHAEERDSSNELTPLSTPLTLLVLGANKPAQFISDEVGKEQLEAPHSRANDGGEAVSSSLMQGQKSLTVPVKILAQATYLAPAGEVLKASVELHRSVDSTFSKENHKIDHGSSVKLEQPTTIKSNRPPELPIDQVQARTAFKAFTGNETINELNPFNDVRLVKNAPFQPRPDQPRVQSSSHKLDLTVERGKAEIVSVLTADAQTRPGEILLPIPVTESDENLKANVSIQSNLKVAVMPPQQTADRVSASPLMANLGILLKNEKTRDEPREKLQSQMFITRAKVAQSEQLSSKFEAKVEFRSNESATAEAGGDRFKSETFQSHSANGSDLQVLPPQSPIVPSSSPALQVSQALRSSGVVQANLTSPSAVATPLNAEAHPLKSLTLQLDPAGLGTVTITVRLKQQDIELRIETASEETLKLLQRDASALHDILRRAGYETETASLQIVLKPASDPIQPLPSQPSSQQVTAGSQQHSSSSFESQPGSSHRRGHDQAQNFQSGKPNHDDGTIVPSGGALNGVFV
jgi:hypothetical protein